MAVAQAEAAGHLVAGEDHEGGGLAGDEGVEPLRREEAALRGEGYAPAPKN